MDGRGGGMDMQNDAAAERRCLVNLEFCNPDLPSPQGNGI